MYLLIVFVVGWFIWYFFIRKSFWDKREVPGPKQWPFFGNIGQNLLGMKTLGEVWQSIYKKYENYPFVGIYRANTPCLFVRDPEFIHRILVRDFNHFQNNELYVDKETDPLFGSNPFILRGQEWRETRQMLTPGFTSGRMKNLFPLFNNIVDKMMVFIEKHPGVTTDGIETRLLTKRYTADNVAKASFGIDGKAFESYDELSDFMQMANEFLSPGSWSAVLAQLSFIFPAIVNISALQYNNRSLEQKITSIVTEVKDYRIKNNIAAGDYLQFLIQLSKEKNFSDTDITSHACTSFFDGYYTTSLVMTYMLLALALNPACQKKLRDEIRETEKKNDGKITYEALQEMSWLNACLFESLRMYPLFPALTKLCTIPYEYTPEDSSYRKLTIKVKEGDVIIIPYGIVSKDPKYFNDPEKFMPERMLEKDGTLNKLFFPFGAGPRVCIGQRLALLQLKIGITQVIKNFEITPSPKLQQPIKYCMFNMANEVKGGVWLQYKKIVN